MLHIYTNSPGTLTQGRLSELVMMKPAWVITILMKYVKMSQVLTHSELSIIRFSTGPTVCIDPPVASAYGYLNRTWDGTKDIQVSKVGNNSKSIFNQFSVPIGQLLL